MPQLVRIRPNRLTVFTPKKPKSIFHHWERSLGETKKTASQLSSEANLSVKKTSFKISTASRRKIFDTINNLYCLSPARTITMKNGRKIFNFKASFITLTLPSSQKHSDTEIKSNCLNQLFVELRKHYGVENYFWKAALQRNENIHFHIILDQYVDYQALRRRWNRILEKLGYISTYAAKFSEMTVNDYHNYRCQRSEIDFKKTSAAYAAGVKSKWRNPNTVDVRSVRSKRELASYLAKYLTKSPVKGETDEQEIERATAFGRCWARSQSLSKLKYVNSIPYEEMRGLLKYFRSVPKKVFAYIGEWCSAFYFNSTDLPKNIADWIEEMVIGNAALYDYPRPG